MSKAAIIEKVEFPKLKTIKGQTAVRVDCPLRNWHGCVYVPRDLNTEQYTAWWEKYQANGGGSEARKPLGHLGDLQRIYQERSHLILECHIEGLKSLDDEPENLALLNFAAAVTQPLIIEARFLPNLPGWSIGSTNGSGAESA